MKRHLRALTHMAGSTQFTVLFREFVAQFFASESATSDHQVRAAVIGVLAFLITPGFLIPIQLGGAFEFIAIRFPAMLTPLIRLIATIFIAYAVVSIGVVAAFAWDALGFDKRDAMVLGPLPVNGTIVVLAKLAALSALLLGAATVVNLMTAIPFALVASNHAGASTTARHFTAHMIATLCAATAMFSLMVIIRAVVGATVGTRPGITSAVQFVLVTAILCFVVLVPTALHAVPARRGGETVFLLPLPAASPTTMFLALHEAVRGTGDDTMRAHAIRAAVLTLATVAVAIVATIGGYRRQVQRALAPPSAPSSHRFGRFQSAVARTIARGDPSARATADFVLATIARSRAQQTPIVLNVAIGMTIVAAALTRAGDLAALRHPRTIVLWIPLVIGYWAIVGIRAAFFVPSELPAAWTFRANGPPQAREYWSATRASLIALVLPPALMITAAAVGPLAGWWFAARHGALVAVVLVAAIDAALLTVHHVPFTRPYRPGHARLKTRWPLYLFGMVLCAYVPVRWELSTGARGERNLLGFGVAVAAALYLAGRQAGARWSVDSGEELTDDERDVAVLDIGQVVHGAHVGG